MRIEKEIDIQAAPHNVFAFLAQSQNMPQWMSAFDTVEQLTPGPPALGTSYRCASSGNPPLEATVEWVVFEDNHKLAWSGPPASVGPGTMQFEGSHTLYSLDGGATRLVAVLETTFGGALKAAGALRGRQIKKDFEKDLDRLKALLESGAA